MNLILRRVGVVAAAVVLALPPAAAQASTPTTPAGPDLYHFDWHRSIDVYRIGAGLAPSGYGDRTGLTVHQRYLVDHEDDGTDCAANLYVELPSCSGYSADGAAAADVTNFADPTGAVDFSVSVRQWWRDPFTAIPMLRPSIQAFAASAWLPAAGVSMLGAPGTQTGPVLFPGNGMTTELTSYAPSRATTDPRETCGWSGLEVGLPIIALLPAAPGDGVTATLANADGASFSTAAGDLCVVDEHTFQTSDALYGPRARQLLVTDHAVVLIPRHPLTNGRYSVSLEQPGQAPIQWQFVDGPAGPVAAGQTYRLHVANNNAFTVMGNLTVTGAPGPGYGVVYPCGEVPPATSNVNYVPYAAAATFAAVHPDPSGDICFHTSTTAHFLWDQTVEVAEAFAHTPVRKFDSRGGQPLLAGHTFSLKVAGTGTTAVMGTMTVVHPAGPGYVTAYPCDSARPHASNINFVRGQTVANFAAVKPSVDGWICFYTTTTTDLIWDQVVENTALTLSSPTRLLNTRATGHRIRAGWFAGRLHVAAPGTTAVFANLTVVDPSGRGWASAVTCSNVGQDVSTVNYRPHQTVANFVVVRPDAHGDVCFATSSDTDLIWDQVGTSTTFPAHTPIRLEDTRSPAASSG